MDLKLFKVESADTGAVYTIRMDSFDPRYIFICVFMNKYLYLTNNKGKNKTDDC
jgi:hypothetical protein